jgi:hypothetical protein
VHVVQHRIGFHRRVAEPHVHGAQADFREHRRDEQADADGGESEQDFHRGSERQSCYRLARAGASARNLRLCWRVFAWVI